MTENNYSYEVKRCPFCGCENVVTVTAAGVELEYEPKSYVAMCCSFHHGGCGATGGFRPDRELAVLAWNGRYKTKETR